MLAVSFVIGFIMVFMGVLLVSKFDHLLSVFICLEFLSLVVFMLLIFFFNFFFFLLVLFFLVISASESVLGLTLFVYFIRFAMKDYIFSLGVLTF